MDDNEDHERIEEAGTPEESKQLESEKASNYLKIDCFFWRELMLWSEREGG